jgi:hypothetical protein
MTPEQIRDVKVSGTSYLTNCFLRELAAQVAEGVYYLAQISTELQTIRNKS